MGLFKRLKADRDRLKEAREVFNQPGFGDMVRSGWEAAAKMQSPGAMQHLVEEAQRAAALASSGVPTPATVRAVERVAPEPAKVGTGSAPPGFGPAGDAPTFDLSAVSPPEVKVDVEVHPPGQQPYEASFTQAVPEQGIAALAPGATITVKIDPSDPSSMLLWGLV
jgi:hypothetical protein